MQLYSISDEYKSGEENRVVQSCLDFKALEIECEKWKTAMPNIRIRPIIPSDDPKIAEIIRKNLEEFHLDIPGTAYFAPELNCLSRYYDAEPDKRAYFIALDDMENVTGGVGVAEFDGFDHCAEIQKLYLSNAAKGQGFSKRLMHIAENFARGAGYRSLYLETHSNLQAAIRLYERLGFERIEIGLPQSHWL